MSKANGLRALELAQILQKEILSALDDYKGRDVARVRAQLAESIGSVAANIAEGYGRGTKAERVNRLRIARGEMEETQAHLNIAVRCSYMSTERFYPIWNRTVVLHRMLAKLMRKD